MTTAIVEQAAEIARLRAALDRYDQPVRTAIQMLHRRGTAAGEIADELLAALAFAVGALAPEPEEEG